MKLKITKKNVVEQITVLSSEKKWKEALELVRRFKVRNLTVTRDTIKKDWKVLENKILDLNYIEVTNPYYKKSGAMRLFLLAEINDVFGLK